MYQIYPVPNSSCTEISMYRILQGGRGDGDPHPHPHGGGDGDGVGMKFSQVGIPTCKILPFQILIQIKNCNSNKNLKKSDFFVEFFFDIFLDFDPVLPNLEYVRSQIRI